jgi:hypothetical protein
MPKNTSKKENQEPDEEASVEESVKKASETADKKKKDADMEHVGHVGDEAATHAPKKPDEDHVHVASQPSLKLYRRIAIGFVLLVVGILAVVLYASLVKAEIYVDPVEEVVKTEFLLDVVRTPTEENDVRGRVMSGTVGRTQTFEPSGEGQREVEGTASGTVTIYNDSSQSQPLIATTRLLTPDEVLFRIQEDVTVPANGSVQVEARADQPGEQGDVGPTEFIIPGLSEVRQEAVYAENSEPFTGGLQTISVLSEDDIQRAETRLRERLVSDGKDLLREEVGDVYGGESFESEIVQKEIDAEAGEEVDEFEVSMTVSVTGVFFDDQAVSELATMRLYDELSGGREFVSVNKDEMQVEVERVNVEEEQANLRVYMDGVAITSQTSQALQPGRFTGKSPQEIRNMLEGEGLAESVRVELTPSWIGSAPRLEDHIMIKIEE